MFFFNMNIWTFEWTSIIHGRPCCDLSASDHSQRMSKTTTLKGEFSQKRKFFDFLYSLKHKIRHFKECMSVLTMKYIGAQKKKIKIWWESFHSGWTISFRSINAATKSLLVQGKYQTIQHTYKLDTKPNLGSQSEMPAASFYWHHLEFLLTNLVCLAKSKKRDPKFIQRFMFSMSRHEY